MKPSFLSLLNKIKVYLIVGFFFMISHSLLSQNQLVADSLEIIYEKGLYNQEDKLIILDGLAESHSDPDKKLTFSEALILEAERVDSIKFLYSGYLQKGTALRSKGDLGNALDSYFQAAKLANRQDSNGDIGVINIAIADVYSVMGNHNNAVSYYQQAINMLESENDSINMATALLNIGDEYFNHGAYDSAMVYTKQSEILFKAINSPLGQAYSLGNIGMIYAELGLDSQAEDNMNRAIVLMQELEQYYPIAVYLTYMADIYQAKKDNSTALNYAFRSLSLAKTYGLKEQIADANLKLSELHEEIGQLEESLKYYKSFISYRDSVNNIETVQQMADLRTDFELSQMQIEMDSLNQERKNQKIIAVVSIIALILIVMMAIGLYRRYGFIKETNRIIQNETDKSEKLLLNILPKETAIELKAKGKVKAKQFDSVTVMFTDFKDFTRYSHNLSPDLLVKSVDYYFSQFDTIIEKYGLEKIKTIGDAYMCAGGLPFQTKDHHLKMVQAGFEIVNFVEESKKLKNKDIAHFELRIGINTGPVVAGVVGTKKFSYDIWGDTVNVASRMESGSEPGRINVSENTYNLIKNKFDCEYRGEIEVKNKGMMKMYFVKEPKGT